MSVVERVLASAGAAGSDDDGHHGAGGGDYGGDYGGGVRGADTSASSSGAFGGATALPNEFAAHVVELYGDELAQAMFGVDASTILKTKLPASAAQRQQQESLSVKARSAATPSATAAAATTTTTAASASAVTGSSVPGAGVRLDAAVQSLGSGARALGIAPRPSRDAPKSGAAWRRADSATSSASVPASAPSTNAATGWAGSGTGAGAGAGGRPSAFQAPVESTALGASGNSWMGAPRGTGTAAAASNWRGAPAQGRSWVPKGGASGARTDDVRVASYPAGASNASASSSSGGALPRASQQPPQQRWTAGAGAQGAQSAHSAGTTSGSLRGDVFRAQYATLLSSRPHLDKLENEVIDCAPERARMFVIKSITDVDVYQSVMHGVWASTANGNRRLNDAWHESSPRGEPIYLLFSVNGSGRFCGLARMASAVDFNASLGIWQKSVWKGMLRVEWLLVKNVPNKLLRDIILPNNDNRPLSFCRDTQEVLLPELRAVLNVVVSAPVNAGSLLDSDPPTHVSANAS